MSVLGIVAEYNPFHRGHLHHLRTAVASVSPDSVLVALSGPFTQRGEAALLSPFARAECALAAGADAVVALPVLWTVRDAEHYALGAVSLLASLGATHLAFGAETADLPLLQRTADLLEDPPASLRDTMRALLRDGRGWPSALSEAAGVCFPECAALLKQPNNILAVCYLRAVRRLGLQLIPVPVPRSGVYRADDIDPACPSASAIREALRRGVWKQALSALPDESVRQVRRAFLSGETPALQRLDAVMIDKIRSMTTHQVSSLADCAEGLDAALLKAAARVRSREELIAMLTTRRYPSARISRLCASALLDITRDQLDNLPLPDSALLLAIKKNPSLTGSWKNSSVKVLPASGWKETASPADLAAWRVWASCSGLPASWPFTLRLPSAP